MMLLCLYELFMWKSNVSCLSPFIFNTCVLLSCSFRCLQAGRQAAITFCLLLQTRKHTFLSIQGFKGRLKQVTFLYTVTNESRDLQGNAVMFFLEPLLILVYSFILFIVRILRLTTDKIVTMTFAFSFLSRAGPSSYGRGLVTQPCRDQPLCCESS